MKRGSGGASPPEANGMKRCQIKLKLLLFNESISFEASLFFITFNKAVLFILSQIKETCIFFKTQPDYQMVRAKKMYNLYIVKKAKLESGSHRWEIGKGGGLGAMPPEATKFQRIKTP